MRFVIFNDNLLAFNHSAIFITPLSIFCCNWHVFLPLMNRLMSSANENGCSVLLYRLMCWLNALLKRVNNTPYTLYWDTWFVRNVRLYIEVCTGTPLWTILFVFYNIGKPLLFRWDYLFFIFRTGRWVPPLLHTTSVGYKIWMERCIWQPYCFPGRVMYYNDVIMSAVASQTTSLTIVYSTIYSRHRSKKTSKLRVTGLCEGNSPVAGEFPAKRARNAENVPIWWRHHVCIRWPLN